ncbi:MAG TPA: FAD-dependent oxidoreductase, partial [Thermoanaerobaculia bacterium]
MRTREERLAELERSRFDVLVVGGGITGAAAARDAASRGLSVALVEKNDWGSGTSWRSTKLVHGGLRYLRQGEIRLVFESLSERARLLEIAPHLVRPLDFLFAALAGRWVSRWKMEAGLTLYDVLALGRSRRHRSLSVGAAIAAEPLLAGAAFAGG